MDYSSLLHDFVDGTLNSNQEDKLFMMLSSNEELRSELKQFIALESTAKNDTEAFTPPIESSSLIFSKLGIATAPVAVATPAITNTFLSSLKNLSSFFTASISAILGAVTVFFIMSNEDIGTVYQSQAAVIHPDIIANKLSSNNQNNQKLEKKTSIPIISSISNNENSNINSKDITRNDQTDYITKENNEEKDNNIDKNTINPLNNQLLSNSEYIRSNVNMVRSSDKYISKNNANYLERNDLWDEAYYEMKKMGFTFELQGSQYFSIPKQNVQQSTYPAFNNTAIGVYYSINDYFSIGIRARQEYFSQKYSGYEGLDKYTYEQYTNYWSAELSMRYQLYASNWFNSSLETSLGGNKAGAFGRISNMYEILPSSNYSFIFGVEASLLRFHHDNKYFYSPKIGINYGLLFKL